MRIIGPSSPMLAVVVLISGCDLFDTPEYEYCGGTNNCCTLTDTRTQQVKHFCVTDPKDCVADNKWQSVSFPSTPGKGQCQAKRVGSLLGNDTTQFAYAPNSTGKIWERLQELSRDRMIHWVANEGGLDCSFVCDAASPLCNEVAVPFDYGDELDQVAELFRSSHGVVPKSEIMAIFGETTDGCERRDVFISGDRFSNQGSVDTCIAMSQVNVGTSSAPEIITMQVVIPSEVNGKLVREGGNVGARFDAGTEPVILFNNDPTSIYSGPLTQISTKGQAIIATIGGSCLFMPKGDI